MTPRALVIEDNQRLGQSIVRALEADGLEVEHAARGDIGLTRAMEGQFDVVVLDLRLPGTGGLDVLRALRERGRTTPILIVSARDTVDDRVAGLEAGADDYLVKPFSVAELIARVHVLLRRPQRYEPLTCGNLELDPVAGTVTVEGTDVPLSPRERAVLQVLLTHAPAVVSREVLIDAVWGFQFEGLDNALEVQISAVRKHLRRVGASVTITTHRARGYAIAPASVAADA